MTKQPRDSYYTRALVFQDRVTIVADKLDHRYQEFLAEESSEVQHEVEGEGEEGSREVAGGKCDEKKVINPLRASRTLNPDHS